jgi:GT2 family glycosyltransferase
MELSPIILFTYNRLAHTRNTIDALKKNELAAESDLIVFSDGPKTLLGAQKVNEVREYVRTITGFRSVKLVERDSNLGLGTNIVAGVTSVVNEFGRAIVLEDDLETSRYFLRFMNEAPRKYEHDDRVISVVGYIYNLPDSFPKNFFLRGADCLGWATWKRGWDLFEEDAEELRQTIKKNKWSKDFNFNGSYNYTQMLKDHSIGLINSWAIRWYGSAYIHGKLTLYPGSSLINHKGNDGTGTNYSEDTVLDVPLAETPVELYDIPVEENRDARRSFENFFRKHIKKDLIALLKFDLKRLRLRLGHFNKSK